VGSVQLFGSQYARKHHDNSEHPGENWALNKKVGHKESVLNT